MSNASDQDVFFDNLKVGIVAGNIIEEDHYYAYGLKIAAISSKKLGDVQEGKLSNPFLYNGKELLDEDMDLGWYDYGFRDYDPQIGRFPQLDPLTWEYPELTNYQYASCDPITNVDMDGLEGTSAIGAAAKATEQIAQLENVTVIALRKIGTTAPTIAKVKQLFATTERLVNLISKINTTQAGEASKSKPKVANTLIDMTKQALLDKNKEVDLGKDFIDEIKQDPDYKRLKNDIVNEVKKDPRYGKQSFYADFKAKDDQIFHHLGLGGGKDSDPMWKQALRPWRYKKTWKVALNPLTWAIRNCTVYEDAFVDGDGNIDIYIKLTDTWDLSKQNGRGWEYNAISKGGGFLWHKVARANVLNVSGQWLDNFYNFKFSPVPSPKPPLDSPVGGGTPNW